MRVSHVIRGEDHLSNTPRQILVYRALGWDPPSFAHHPLILGADRSPLSKRHGATTVAQYREEGFLPEALLNYLALLGWTSPSGKEVLSQEEILGEFSLQAFSRSAPVFNRQKLEWLNSHYIHHMSDEQLAKWLAPCFEKAGIPVSQLSPGEFLRISGALKENLIVLSQADEYLGIFFDDQFHVDEEARALLSEETSRETLRAILRVMEGTGPVTDEACPAVLARLGKETGCKGKALYAPLRAAVTGKMKGPELVKTLPILGRERIIKRITMALAAQPGRVG